MVTILLATYNGERYLSELLKSIEQQSYCEWELIVRDDGSTDATVSLLQKFQKSVSQKVVIQRNTPATGSAKKNFALLIKDAADRQCEYIMCCDQDDVWKTDKIAHTLDEMRDDVPFLVHTDLEVVDSGGKTTAASMFDLSQIRRNPGLAQLLVQNTVTGCTMMMNNKLLWLIADYVDDDAVIMHDYWAALTASIFGELVFLPESTICYRQHEENSVGAKDSRSGGYLIKRLKVGKKNYSEAMQQSFRQIQKYVEDYEEQMLAAGKEQELELMRGYGQLSASNHRERERYYWKHHIWKSGKIRKLMQLLWG